MTVTVAVALRVASFAMTSLWANAEKPSPPNSRGMIIPMKPSSRMNCQTCAGRSFSSYETSQSSSMSQSVSTGPSRKACSASVSVGFGKA